MAFAITANFLLGTYQGSDSGGRPEPYPSPDRLYKACVAAAYNTFDFERQTDDRVLTDEQIKNALAWLEDNTENPSSSGNGSHSEKFANFPGRIVIHFVHQSHFENRQYRILQIQEYLDFDYSHHETALSHDQDYPLKTGDVPPPPVSAYTPSRPFQFPSSDSESQIDRHPQHRKRTGS